eukprot:4867102-Pyramimonas_sp.AAC.1
MRVRAQIAILSRFCKQIGVLGRCCWQFAVLPTSGSSASRRAVCAIDAFASARSPPLFSGCGSE